MPNFQDIVAKGYFPRELPPCFSTAGFAAAVSDSGGLSSAYGAILPKGTDRRGHV